MNHYENKEAKKYLAAAVIVAVFAAAVVGMVMFAQGERQRRLENVAFYALLAEVQKHEPADRWKTIDAYFKSCGELQGDGFCSVKAAVWFDRARAGFAGIGTVSGQKRCFLQF